MIALKILLGYRRFNEVKYLGLGMISVVRFFVIVAALALMGVSIYPIWYVSEYSILSRICLSATAVFASIVITSIFGEHVIKLLKHSLRK